MRRGQTLRAEAESQAVLARRELALARKEFGTRLLAAEMKLNESEVRASQLHREKEEIADVLEAERELRQESGTETQRQVAQLENRTRELDKLLEASRHAAATAKAQVVAAEQARDMDLRAACERHEGERAKWRSHNTTHVDLASEAEHAASEAHHRHANLEEKMMMQKASVGAQIQAVITEADQRVAQAKEEGQQRLAEALAESGEFAAKVAAKQSRTLALAVEEAERRGMERGAVPKGGYVGGPGGQQSSPLTGGRPPSIPRAASSEMIDTRGGEGTVKALRAEVQMMKGALTNARCRVTELEGQLQKKKSARELHLEGNLEEASTRLEDLLEQHLVDEDVKLHLQTRIKGQEKEAGMRVAMQLQEEDRFRKRAAATAAMTAVHPWSLWELGAHSVPSCHHGTGKATSEALLAEVDEACLRPTLDQLEPEAAAARRSFSASFTSTTSGEGPVEGKESSGYSAHLAAADRFSERREEHSMSGGSMDITGSRAARTTPLLDL